MKKNSIQWKFKIHGAIGYDLVIDVEEIPQAVQEEAQQKHYQELKFRTFSRAINFSPQII